MQARPPVASKAVSRSSGRPLRQPIIAQMSAKGTAREQEREADADSSKTSACVATLSHSA